MGVFLAFVFYIRFYVKSVTPEQKTDVKNESSFEVIILRGVVLAFYRFEIFCKENFLGFGRLVLEIENFNHQG